MSRKLLIIVVILVLLVGGGLAAIWKFEPFRTYNPPLGKVEFYRAEEEPANDLMPVDGLNPNQKIYLYKQPDLTSEDIADVRVNESKETGPNIEMVFKPSAKNKLAEIVRTHQKKPLAMLVNGKLVFAPLVYGEFGTKIQISGHFTKEEVETIVSQMLGK